MKAQLNQQTSKMLTSRWLPTAVGFALSVALLLALGLSPRDALLIAGFGSSGAGGT